MTDSEFLEDRAKGIFEKFKSFIPEEHQSSVLNSITMGMLKCHIDIAQNVHENEEEEEEEDVE